MGPAQTEPETSLEAKVAAPRDAVPPGARREEAGSPEKATRQGKGKGEKRGESTGDGWTPQKNPRARVCGLSRPSRTGRADSSHPQGGQAAEPTEQRVARCEDPPGLAR